MLKMYGVKLHSDFLSIDAMCNKHLTLLISIGDNAYNIYKFKATLEKLVDISPQSIVIMLADTLQRHNYDFSYEDAYEAGSLWIQKHADIIKEYAFLNIKIMRWDAYFQVADYQKYRKEVLDLFDSNQEFHNAVYSTANAFLKRAKNNKTSLENCISYILEELPIIMPLSASLGTDMILYPKKMTEAMALTQQLLVKERYKTKGSWITLLHKRKRCA